MLLTGCSIWGNNSAQESTLPSDSSAPTIATMASSTEATATSSVPVETEPPISFTEEFINYFYMNLLGRDATSEEIQLYRDDLENGSISVNNFIISIIESSEFTSRGYSNEEYVNLCYSVLSQDFPSEELLTYWCDVIDSGTSFSDVAQEFMSTDAFRELCSSYGLMPFYEGEMAPGSTPREVIEGANGDKIITGVGGYTPSAETLNEINEALDSISSRGWSVGFLVIDMQSNLGIVYNLDQEFYTASSIKGPFATSLAMYNPEAAANREYTIVNMLVNSDNDAYTSLNDSYRRTYIQQFCEECGVDPALCVYKYPTITTRDLGLMWIYSYYYFDQDEFSQTVGSWFETPYYSLIHSELGEMYTTRSKAGWVADDNPKHTTTVDAGIVYSDHGDYVVVIMSRVPSSIEPLRPLMQALNRAHDEM